MLKSTFSGLQRCWWQYRSIFIRRRNMCCTLPRSKLHAGKLMRTYTKCSRTDYWPCFLYVDRPTRPRDSSRHSPADVTALRVYSLLAKSIRNLRPKLIHSPSKDIYSKSTICNCRWRVNSNHSRISYRLRDRVWRLKIAILPTDRHIDIRNLYSTISYVLRETNFDQMRQIRNRCCSRVSISQCSAPSPQYNQNCCKTTTKIQLNHQL